jgi:hypothetical protein
MAGRFIGIASLLSLGCMGAPAFRVHRVGLAFRVHTGGRGFLITRSDLTTTGPDRSAEGTKLMSPHCISKSVFQAAQRAKMREHTGVNLPVGAHAQLIVTAGAAL